MRVLHHGDWVESENFLQFWDAHAKYSLIRLQEPERCREHRVDIMTKSGQILKWQVELKGEYAIASFEIARKDGILGHNSLANIELPKELKGNENRGLILSGRGPIWLYTYLSHLAHTFAWVAVHDPRCGGAVVVQRHTEQSPSIGEIVPLSVRC